MANIPSRVHSRIVDGLKKFQSIVQSAKTRDVNESDTVIIVTDMLSYIFGFDKYSEITSEYTIRGTYCDLATKIDNKPQYLIEVKAIGLELKDHYVKQAIARAFNKAQRAKKLAGEEEQENDLSAIAVVESKVE